MEEYTQICGPLNPNGEAYRLRDYDNRDNERIYVHILKNASTYLRPVYRDKGFQRSHIRDIKEEIRYSIPCDIYLRDPIDRFYSAVWQVYKELIMRPRMYKPLLPDHHSNRIRHKITLDQFLDRVEDDLLNNNNIIYDGHMLPQLYFIYPFRHNPASLYTLDTLKGTKKVNHSPKKKKDKVKQRLKQYLPRIKQFYHNDILLYKAVIENNKNIDVKNFL